MINFRSGNLLHADSEALVNTVNCVGYMGKGIALQFKFAFPTNNVAYERACKTGEVRIGSMFVFRTGETVNPKYIINFPTKQHYRNPSRLADIKLGLQDLVRVIKTSDIHSIAIPPLGCGLGGLKWDDVRPLIVQAMESLPEVKVIIYEPSGAPTAKDMPVHTKKPALTTARALLIQAMQVYRQADYSLTLLEIQKLAYFLQEAGQPLRLSFTQAEYGPYAVNLNKVLEHLERHYIEGYNGSTNPSVEITILPEAVRESRDFLIGDDTTRARLERITDLITGFDTPYGMELLSSVHWVVHHQDLAAADEERAIEAVHKWNARKRNILKEKHLRIAWKQLKKKGWL